MWILPFCKVLKCLRVEATRSCRTGRPPWRPLRSRLLGGAPPRDARLRLAASDRPTSTAGPSALPPVDRAASLRSGSDPEP